MSEASRVTGAAAADYEIRKRTFLNTEEECRQQGILFVPLVAESSGGWGASAFSVFKRMAKLAAHRGGLSSPARAALPLFLERLSVSIRSAKARAALRRAGPGSDPASSAAETAAAAICSSS